VEAWWRCADGRLY